MKNAVTSVRKYFSAHPILIALIVMWIIMAFASPYFFQLSNFLNVLNQNSPLAISAVGMTFALIVGEIDLSVSAMLTLTGCSCGIMMMQQGCPYEIRNPRRFRGGSYQESAYLLCAG